MSEAQTAALWHWFLFESGLTPQRAKALLADWSARGLTLEAVLAQAPARAQALGLTHDEAARLRAPAALPDVQALTWEDARYPAGLRALALKRRPALLFFRGEPALLERPLIYLAPGTLTSDEEDGLREVIDLLLGEEVLLAAYEGSPQAELVLEALTYAEGEGSIFARSGLATREPPELEAALVAAARLVVISPLAPTTAYQPSWDALLQEVAAVAADRIILSAAESCRPERVAGLEPEHVLAITELPSDAATPPNISTTTVPADVLVWLEGLLYGIEGELPPTGPLPAEMPPAEARPLDAEDVDLGPPPSPEEILDTLQSGGKIPEVLRRRLLGEEDETPSA